MHGFSNDAEVWPWHSQVTCEERLTRGLVKDSPPPEGPFFGSCVFRKFNGQWRLMMHCSGRQVPIREQIEEMVSPSVGREDDTTVGSPD
jgi:hypothetical protein